MWRKSYIVWDTYYYLSEKLREEVEELTDATLQEHKLKEKEQICMVIIRICRSKIELIIKNKTPEPNELEELNKFLARAQLLSVDKSHI